MNSQITKKTALGVGLSMALLALAGCASQPTAPKTSQKINISVKNGVPSHYQVQAGDTVAKIAKRYNLNWREVSAINRLDNNHTIYIGQWLVLWQNHSVGKADFSRNTVATKPVPAPAPTLKSTVKQSVGQVNTQRVHTPIQVSKPANTQTQTTPTQTAQSAPKPKPQASTPTPIKELPKSTTPPPTAPQPQTPPVAANAPKTTESGLPLLTPMGNTPLVGASAVRHFRYPVSTQNKVVRQFGSLVNGAKSEGMFFSGHDGDVVVASQSGIVIYADDNNKTGSPKAVMIEHSNGYVSSYIHLKDIAVKKGQSVAIGASVGSMQEQAAKLALFEFRMAKDGQYIDPVSVLK